MVELESNWGVGVGNDLQRTVNHATLVGQFRLPFPPFYAWL